MNLRAEAARCLAPLLRQQGSLAQQLPRAQESLSAPDRALLQELVYGSCRLLPRLQLLVAERLRKPLKHRDADIQALLIVGAYQLLHMRIPAHAALHETVSASADLGKGWARGLINAVLRGLQRQPQPSAALATEPSFLHAHPGWLIRALESAWPEDAEAILAANNQSAPLVLRVNVGRVGRQDFLARLEAAGINAEPCLQALTGVRILNAGGDVTLLPGFAEGHFSVQDEGAQLAVPLLDLQPGQAVLDACAAPGGKTAQMLESQPVLGPLTALEIKADRLERLQQNLQRLGLSCRSLQGDASQRDWWPGEAYDRILADVPCSGTGVIRRHPDIKVLRRDKDLASLNQQQMAILENLWALLRPGGKLLYATCSILPRENEQLVGEFLARHAEAADCTPEVPWGLKRHYGVQTLPRPGEMDGFYYALLLKQPCGSPRALPGSTAQPRREGDIRNP